MHILVKLAKEAVENYIKTKNIINPISETPAEFLNKKSGVFVTIYQPSMFQATEKNNKQLRGCVGTFLATKENIALETINNAISAATKDNRFDPVSELELSDLIYQVSILNTPQLVKNISDLDPKKYGLIIGTSLESEVRKFGLLLPDLEGIESVDEKIAIVCRKADIDLAKDKIILYSFTTEKYI